MILWCRFVRLKTSSVSSVSEEQHYNTSITIISSLPEHHHHYQSNITIRTTPQHADILVGRLAVPCSKTWSPVSHPNCQVHLLIVGNINGFITFRDISSIVLIALLFRDIVEPGEKVNGTLTFLVISK